MVKKSIAIAVLASLLMTLFIAVVPLSASAVQDYGIENVQIQAFEGWTAETLTKIKSENATLSLITEKMPPATASTSKHKPTKSLAVTAVADGNVSFAAFDADGALVVPTFANRYDEASKTFSITSGGGSYEGFCLWFNANMLGAGKDSAYIDIVLSDAAGKKASFTNPTVTGALANVADGGSYEFYPFTAFTADEGFNPLNFTHMELTVYGIKEKMQLVICDPRFYNFTESYIQVMEAVGQIWGADEYEEAAYEAYAKAYDNYIGATLNANKATVDNNKAALDAAIVNLHKPQIMLYDLKGFRAYKSADIDEMYEQLYCRASLINNKQSGYVYDYDDVENVYAWKNGIVGGERIAGENSTLKILKLVCTEVEGWMQFCNYDREDKLEDGQPIPISNDFFGKDMSGYTGIRFYMNFRNIPESRAKSADVIIGTYGEEPNQVFTAHIDGIKESGYYEVPFSSFDNQDKLPEYFDKLDTFGIKFNDITNGVEVAITDVKAYVLVDTLAKKMPLANLINEIENEYEESFWSRQSWANLLAQKNASLKVLGTKGVSQAEVDASFNKLTAAVNALKKPQYALLRFPGFGAWTADELASMTTNGATFSLTKDQAYLAKDDEGKDVTDTGLLMQFKAGTISLYSYSQATSGKKSDWEKFAAVNTPFVGRNCTGYDGIRVYLYMPKGGAPTRVTMTIGNCNAFMSFTQATAIVDTSEMSSSGYIYMPFSDFKLNNADLPIDYEFLDYFAFSIQGSYLVQDAFYCLSDISAYKLLDDEGNPEDGDLVGASAPRSVLPIAAAGLLAFALCLVFLSKRARSKRSCR